jgi:hypothetical protein
MGASSSDSAQLLLSIDASTEILRSEVARATATIDKLEHETGKRLDEVKEHFVKLGEKVRETATEFARLGAEILIGQSIKSAIERAIEYSETLNKTAAQLGVTTTFLQEFRFAATNSAVSAEAADKSLAKYSVTLGRAADGNKTAAKAFADIGVKIADTSGNLRPAEAIFRDVADAVKSMKSPAEQAAAAVAIFGRGGQSLLCRSCRRGRRALITWPTRPRRWGWFSVRERSIGSRSFRTRRRTSRRRSRRNSRKSSATTPRR